MRSICNKLAFLLLAILQLAGLPGRAAAQDGGVRYIRRIQIIRENVVAVGAEVNSIGRTVNGLHTVTRDGVVRRELQFDEGDVLDPDLLSQSERNLRDLDIFSNVEVRAVDVAADSADVLVMTQDQWSLIPGFYIESTGGLTEVGMVVTEPNLFGTAKSILAEGIYQSDVKKMQWSFGYSDPQLLSTHWELQTVFSYGELLKGAEVFLRRPFYSLDTKWSYGTGGYTTKEIRRVFEAGEEVSRYNFDSQYFVLFLGRAFGKRYRKTRVTLDLSYQERIFSPIPGQTTLPLAQDELIYKTEVSVRRENIRYIKVTRLDRFVTTEDLTMGGIARLSVGRAGFPIAKGVNRWEFEASYSHAYEVSKRQNLFWNAGYETKVVRDHIFSFGTRYYYRLRWQTLAFNMRMKLSRKLEAGRQFVLGSDSGLRGYPAREFSGDKMFLMNLESRILPDWQLLSVHLGGVVFIDAGNAYKRGEPFDLRNINSSAGVGLRLGFARFAGATVGRVDVGWPLNRVADPVVTFGVDQYF